MPVATDARVDAYIGQAADFARPILIEARARFHKACPELVETLKWRAPSFEHHGLIGGIASFKEHCSVMWWHEKRLAEIDQEVAAVIDATAKMRTVKDLPGKRAFARAVKAAMQLNESGTARKNKKAPRKAAMHPEFEAALQKDLVAKKQFDGFAAGYRRDYVEWIQDARRDATRQRRIAQAIEWLREGKHRNWKYENC